MSCQPRIDSTFNAQRLIFERERDGRCPTGPVHGRRPCYTHSEHPHGPAPPHRQSFASSIVAGPQNRRTGRRWLANESWSGLAAVPSAGCHAGGLDREAQRSAVRRTRRAQGDRDVRDEWPDRRPLAGWACSRAAPVSLRSSCQPVRARRSERRETWGETWESVPKACQQRRCWPDWAWWAWVGMAGIATTDEKTDEKDIDHHAAALLRSRKRGHRRGAGPVQRYKRGGGRGCCGQLQFVANGSRSARKRVAGVHWGDVPTLQLAHATWTRNTREIAAGSQFSHIRLPRSPSPRESST
ncbi:hypothetical protein CIB48_g5062 [Xylaria polymorpha]|nr:hypothetical protein CIB48_g5062 [Xylaria polymorpha]